MGVFRKPIFLILLAALVLRLWGISYALPQFFVNDERANVYGALKMLELKTLVPAWHSDEFKKVLNYLPLPSYVYLMFLTPVIGIGYLFSGAGNLAAYQTALVLDPTIIFLAARLLIALMGTAMVLATYQLGRKMFSSERTGLLAAIFLAVSFYHVQLSHVTRHWMPAALFLSLAWLAALAIHRRGRMRDYLWAGMFAGLGVGANTAAAVGMIPVALAYLFRADGRGFWGRIADRRLALAVGVFVSVSLLFVALYPYGLTQGEGADGNRAFLQVKLERLAQKGIGGWLEFLGFYARLLLTYETTLFLAAGAGALLLLRSARYYNDGVVPGSGSRGLKLWLGIIAIFTLGYFTLLYLFFNIIERAILFILPLLAVLAGYFVDRALLWFQNRIRPSALPFLICALLLFAWPLAVVLRYDYLLTREDTRILAAEWLYANTPPDAKILADLSYLRLANTKAGIRALAAIDPTGLRIQDRTLLTIPDDRYPRPAREILNLHFVGPDSPYRQAAEKSFFTRQGYRYLAVEYAYPDRRDLDPATAALMAQGTLLRRLGNWRGGAIARALDLSGEISTVPPWRFWAIERFGLTVDIYEL